MLKVCSRFLAMALVVVAFVIILPERAYAGPGAAQAVRIAEVRAQHWNEAVDRFAAQRTFTIEQTQFIEDAYALGDQIALLRQDERAQALFARKATRFLEHARELFSSSELGQLFSSMGQTQIWFAELAAAPAFCSCHGIQQCQMPGGPTGDCKAGCQSWDDSSGQRWDGLCTPSAAAD